jgi:hydrogenase-4 component B
MTMPAAAFVAFLVVSVGAAMVAWLTSGVRTPAVQAALGLGQTVLLIVAGISTLATGGWTLGLWRMPGWGQLELHAGTLGAFFGLLAAVIYGAIWIYSPGYLGRHRSETQLKTLWGVMHLLLASIALVLWAGDVLTFLLAWEVMSVLSYLTVVSYQLDDSSARAGYVMLAASEAGFLAVVAAWMPLVLHAHSIVFTAIIRQDAVSPVGRPAAAAVFLLATFGFGVKSGLFPTMSWLPRAHPVAPANASAVLSGIILNLGVYGIVLTDARLLPVGALWEGLVLLAFATATALVGILYAATDNHMKRMLAHSSVENLGLVLTAVGVALTFDAAHLPVLGGIAWIAAFYQMMNHSVYKALLFLGAGAVDHSAGELDLDRLGGLGRRMPWTALFMLAGTLAIASLPPLNGFVSEWLILQSLLRSVDLHRPVYEALFAGSGVIVALTAGLAATAFTRLYGMTFLGRPRSGSAEGARETPVAMRWAMGLLSGIALLLGLMPTYVAAGLGRLAASLTGAAVTRALIPSFFAPKRLSAAFVESFHQLGAQIGQFLLPPPGLVFLHQGQSPTPHVVFAMAPSYLAIALLAAALVAAAAVRYILPRTYLRERKASWAGGVRRLSPDMGYTATGFANPIRTIFRAILSPSEPVDVEEREARHFPMAIRREARDVYAVDRWFVLPTVALGQAAARLLALMHRGSVNAYAAYVLVTLLLLLLAVRFG